MTQYESQVCTLSYEPLGGEEPTWNALMRSGTYDTYEAAYAHARKVAEDEMSAGMCIEYRIYVYTIVDGEEVGAEKW